MTIIRFLRCIFSACVVSLALPASSDVPQSVNYQGQLLDASGVAATGPVGITIGIWDSASGGSQPYREDHVGVPLTGGLFHIAVGAGSPVSGTFGTAIFSDPGRWLELRVNGELLLPRKRFRSVPYALRAANAERLGSLTVPQLISASEGPQGPPGATGPAGNAGPPGPSATSSVICALGQSPFGGCQNCGSDTVLARVREPCFVSSESGSCSRSSSQVAECCVCGQFQ